MKGLTQRAQEAERLKTQMTAPVVDSGAQKRAIKALEAQLKTLTENLEQAKFSLVSQAA